MPIPCASRWAWQCHHLARVATTALWSACLGSEALRLSRFTRAGEPWRVSRCHLPLKRLGWVLSAPRAHHCGPSLGSDIGAFSFSTGQKGANPLDFLQRSGVFFFPLSSCVLPSGSAYSLQLLLLLSLLMTELLFTEHQIAKEDLLLLGKRRETRLLISQVPHKTVIIGVPFLNAVKGVLGCPELSYIDQLFFS